MTRVWRTICVLVCLLAPWTLPGVAMGATLAGGSRFTVLVKPDGTVWTWG